LEITSSFKTPDTVQQEYVYTVLMCYVGNPYGVSNAAVEYYNEMIQNFSPKEIGFMLNLLSTKTLFSDKIKNYSNCKVRYVKALELIVRESMSVTQQATYDVLLKN